MVSGPLHVVELGCLAYQPALALMEDLWAARCRGEAPDLLLLLEHLPVITLGMSGGREDLRLPPAELARRGVALAETNRGGRATFHGPGQLVAYPVIRLAELDLHGFLWRLEESVIRLLVDWGIPAGRDDDYPGVWTGGRKIAAVGLAVRQGVTTHGLALNVTIDLSQFGLIHPCGIIDRGVTSMQAELGWPVSLAAVRQDFIREFGRVFQREAAPGALPLAALAIPGGGS
jgi:lipoate-protein ligase B